jgi:hypothetical protein
LQHAGLPRLLGAADERYATASIPTFVGFQLTSNKHIHNYYGLIS